MTIIFIKENQNLNIVLRSNSKKRSGMGQGLTLEWKIKIKMREGRWQSTFIWLEGSFESMHKVTILVHDLDIIFPKLYFP